MVTTSDIPLAEWANTIKTKFKNLNIDITGIYKLNGLPVSSNGGPEEADIFKTIFEVIARIYDDNTKLSGDQDVQCHILVGECFEHLCNVLKKNEIKNKDLCQQAIDVLIAITKARSQSKNILIKFVSNPLIDIVLCPVLHLVERKEFLKALNFVLENSERNLRYKLRNDLKLEKLSKLLYTCGDYETQVNIIETLFRYVSADERAIFVKKWLNDSKEAMSLFLAIKDFEPDCRKFLIKFNAWKTDRLVHSLPCLKAVIGQCEVKKPEDPSYEEFWVDFNLGSRSVSVVCSQESLYSQSIYGSQIMPGFWETLAIECQSVSKVSLQEVSLSISGIIQEDAMEMCMVLVQPCHILFSSFPCNFEGNMIVITFSRRLLSKIQMLIQKLFPEKYSCNLTHAQPSLIKTRKKSSVSIISEENLSEILPCEDEAKCFRETKYSEERILKRQPTPLDELRRRPNEDSDQSALSVKRDSRDCQSKRKVLNSSSKSNSRSPFKPLEIIISPSGTRNGVKTPFSGNMQTCTPKPGSCKSNQVCSMNTSGKSSISKDTGFDTANTPVLSSFYSNKEVEVETDSSESSQTNCNQLTLNSNQITTDIRNKQNERDLHNVQNQVSKNNECNKLSSEFHPDYENKRVLRSQKRLLSNSNIQSSDTDRCLTTSGSQLHELYKETTERKQTGGLWENLSSEKKLQKIEKEDLWKTKEKSHNLENSKPSWLYSKTTGHPPYEMSDTDSVPSWILGPTSEQKYKSQGFIQNKKCRNLTKDSLQPKKFGKCKDHGGSHDNDIPKKHRDGDNTNEQVVSDNGKRNFSINEAKTRRMSSRKKLFNGIDHNLVGPIKQSPRINKDAANKPTVHRKSQQISMKVRHNIDQREPLASNWFSGTESELSWLKDPSREKSNPLKRYSNPKKQTLDKQIRKTLKDTAMNFLKHSKAEKGKRQTNTKKGKTDDLVVSKNTNFNQEGKSSSSSGEEFREDAATSSSSRGKLKTTPQTVQTHGIAEHFDKGLNERDKKIKQASDAKKGTTKNSLSQKDIVVGYTNDINDDKLQCGKENGTSKETLSEGRASGTSPGDVTNLSHKDHSIQMQMTHVDCTEAESVSSSCAQSKTITNNSSREDQKLNFTANLPAMHEDNEKLLNVSLSDQNAGALTLRNTGSLSKSLKKKDGGDNESTGHQKSSPKHRDDKHLKNISQLQSRNISDNRVKKNEYLCLSNLTTTEQKRRKKAKNEEISSYNQEYKLDEPVLNELPVKELDTVSSVNSVDDASSKRERGAVNEADNSPPALGDKSIDEQGTDDESFIPPSLVGQVNEPLNPKNALHEKSSILLSKNVTTHRGSFFNFQLLEGAKRKQYRNVKVKDLPNKSSLVTNMPLENDYCFTSVGKRSKFLRKVCRNQEEEVQICENGTYFWITESASTKNMKGDHRKQLQTSPLKKELFGTTSKKSTDGKLKEEITLDDMLSQFNSKITSPNIPNEHETSSITSTPENTEVGSRFNQLRNLSKSVTKDPFKASHHSHGNPSAGKRKISNEIMTREPKQFKFEKSSEIHGERPTFGRKKQLHCSMDFANKENSRFHITHGPVDHSLDLEASLKKITQKYISEKAECFQDLGHYILMYTKDAAKEIKEEYNSFSEDAYVKKIDEVLKELQDGIDRETAFIARLEKCYKYFYNTTFMKENNDKWIQERIAKMVTLCEEHSTKSTEAAECNINKKYKTILMSKVKMLKETYMQQEQKKGMVKAMSYIKSLMLK